MSKFDKVCGLINNFYKLSNIFMAYEGALSDSANEESSVEKKDVKTIEYKPEILSKNDTYQSPLKVGKMGIEGEDSWVISGFVDKSVNISKRHPQGHEGVDFGAPKNAPVYPIAHGVVTQTSNTPKGGLNLSIYHQEDNLYSYYAHLNKINVSIGDKVSKETIIGLNGDTGSAKGTHPHVHLECKINNKKLDPRSIIGKKIGLLQ